MYCADSEKANPKIALDVAMWIPSHAERPRLDTRNVGAGLQMLRGLRDNVSPLAFFDPQHRSNLDHLRYGNEGIGRGQRRAALRQQSQSEIAEIGREIHRVLEPSVTAPAGATSSSCSKACSKSMT